MIKLYTEHNLRKMKIKRGDKNTKLGAIDVSESVEYKCECGRCYIVAKKDETETKKCPNCARIMYATDQESEQEPNIQSRKHLPNIDDTMEYDYSTENQGRKSDASVEYFTFRNFWKKIWLLFSC